MTCRHAIVAAVLTLAACGRAPPDFWVHGAGVEVESDAPFARAPDLPARLETTLQAALDYWRGDWDALAGTRIVLVDERFSCGAVASASGCWDEDTLRVSTREAGAPLPCVEVTALVHEVGHAVIGDPRHEDPRWMDFDGVAHALGGREGYGPVSSGVERGVGGATGAAGETGETGETAGAISCAIVVSAWRHLPP